MNAGPDAPTRIRYRIRFAKLDLLRWISHRDLAMLWDRLGRRVGLDFSMTEGFHPKPRINFPSALALGVESENEIVEMDLATELEPADLLGRLTSDAQPGLTIRRVERVPEGFGKSRVASLHYQITAPPQCTAAQIDAKIANVMTMAQYILERKKKKTAICPADQIIQLHRSSGDDDTPVVVTLVQREVAGALIKPDEVIALMPIEDFAAQGGVVRRVDVQLTNPYDGSDFAVSGADESLPKDQSSEDQAAKNQPSTEHHDAASIAADSPNTFPSVHPNETTQG